VATCSAPSRKESESSLPGIPKGHKTGQGIDKRTPPLSTTKQRQEGLGGRAFGERVGSCGILIRRKKWPLLTLRSGLGAGAHRPVCALQQIGAASELRFFLLFPSAK
jgi:hypothetical protein